MKLWSTLRGQPREIWILFVTTLVNRMGTMALPFLVLYLSRHLGFSPSLAGLMLAVYGAASLIASPLSGYFSDRIGPFRILEFSLILSGLALVFYPLARGIPAVVAMTILWSLSNELFRPAVLSAVSELARPDQRKPAFALNRLAINLGMSIGPAIGGFLALVSFPSIFIVDGITSLIAGAFLISAFSRMSRRTEGQPASQRAEISKEGVSRGFSDRRFLVFLVAIVPVAMVFFQHESAMALFFVRDLHLKESTYGLMFTLNTLLIVFFELPMNAAMANWPHKRTLALGSVLVGAGFGALALVSGAWGVAVTVVIWTFGEMMLLPGMSAYVADIAPAPRRGEYMGLYTMTFGLAFAIGPWAGTVLLDEAGGRILWSVAFLFGLLSALLLWRATSNRLIPVTPAA